MLRGMSEVTHVLAAIERGDSKGVGFFIRGTIWLDKKQFDRALDDLDEAIGRGCPGAQVFSNRGMAWLAKNDYGQAIADFDEAIRLDPSDGLFFNNRGRARDKQGDYAKASADLREAIRLTPTLPNSYKNLAWLLATCPDPEFRDGRQAVSHAKYALELTGGKMVEWFDILAAAHAEAGDFQAAIDWQTRCVEAAPETMNQELVGRLATYRSHQPFRDRH